MLTSPVNVTIATSNGMSLKPHAAPSDGGSAKQAAALPTGEAGAQTIEPELPSNSLLTHVNAVAATAGNRTILQELSLNIAAMFKLVRRPDETMTALFLRIIAAIEAMPQAERLQFEVRAGLKAQRITLTDLAMALRKPDGPEAARLTAMAEAPATVPGKAAATAATTTYLQEGTANGHAEETLAMRAAARNSAAGQNVFTAEIRTRHAENPPTDAKVLQAQLKSMFEPGEAKPAAQYESRDGTEAASAGDPEVHAQPEAQVAPEADVGAEAHADPRADVGAEPYADAESPPHQAPADDIPVGTADERLPADRGAAPVAISTGSLRLDPQTLEKIRSVAQSLADQSPATEAMVQDRPAKTGVGDQRLQTMLTLKGLVEVVAALPAKAADMITATFVEAAPPLPETASDSNTPSARVVPASYDKEQLPEFAGSSDEHATAIRGDIVSQEEAPADAEAGELTPSARSHKSQTTAAPVDENLPAGQDRPPLARPDLTLHAIPFAYGQVQPAREEAIEAVSEEDVKDDTDDNADREHEEDGEKRRPRDEYDEIHDPVPDEDPAIVINRDSTEADRAFALYQRMGGF